MRVCAGLKSKVAQERSHTHGRVTYIQSELLLLAGFFHCAIHGVRVVVGAILSGAFECPSL